MFIKMQNVRAMPKFIHWLQLSLAIHVFYVNLDPFVILKLSVHFWSGLNHLDPFHV